MTAPTMKKLLENAAKIYASSEEVGFSLLFAPKPKPLQRGRKKETRGRKRK